MIRPATLPRVSFKHAREGMIGVNGQLPLGWSGELLSLTKISRVEGPETGPAVTVHFEFGPSEVSEFVSIVAGPYVHGAASDVFVLGAEIELNDAENIGDGFAIIREWEPNGPCIGQQLRVFSPSARPSHAFVAAQIRDPKHLLQPVFSFRRDATKGGRGVLTVRRMILSSIYEFAEWLV
jgi:hypothetical protein